MKAHTANIKFNTIDLIKADVHKKKKKFKYLPFIYRLTGVYACPQAYRWQHFNGKY